MQCLHLSHMHKKHGDHRFISSTYNFLYMYNVFCVKNFKSYLCGIFCYFVIIRCTGVKQSCPSFGHFIIYFIICYTLFLSACLLPRSNCLTTIAPWFFLSFCRFCDFAVCCVLRSCVHWFLSCTVLFAFW